MSWTKRLKGWMPKRRQLLRNRWLRWLRPWLGQPVLWRWTRHGVALGVALGVFFGLLIPIAQIPATAVAAVLLRANIPAAAASTLISNPITFGPIYYAAWHVGAFLTGEETPPEPPLDEFTAETHAELGWWERVGRLGKPLMVGLGVMATLGGLLTYALVSLVWLWRARAHAAKLALQAAAAPAEPVPPHKPAPETLQ